MLVNLLKLKQMLATLLESGFSVDDLDQRAVDVIGSHLQSQLEANGGTVGFSMSSSPCMTVNTDASQPKMHFQMWTTPPRLCTHYIY